MRYTSLLISIVGFLAMTYCDAAENVLDRLSIDGEQSIMREEHLGIINHHLTCGTPFREVGRIDGLWAPPFVSHDFQVSWLFDSKPVVVERYTWWPVKIEHTGTLEGGIEVRSRLILIEGKRAGLQSISLRNDSGVSRTVPVEVVLGNNTLDWSDIWEFGTERSGSATTAAVDGSIMLFKQGDMAVALMSTLGKWSWDAEGRRGSETISIAPGETKAVTLVFAMGRENDALKDVREIAQKPREWGQRSEGVYIKDLEALYEKLPRFESDNKELEVLYHRSLMHLFTNRWDVEEFCLHPYYGTGSIRGGCVCNYLWNYGEIWEVIHLLDPQASREHIKHFLGLNLTKHFAFLPVTGKAFGPWYMVNQEKIIGHVYFYVKLTGDVSFLSEQVDGRSIMDHMLEQAWAHDDPSKPVALIDYGPSNSHLELRRKPNYYNHVMPDLNGRRYANYMMVSALADALGEPDPRLAKRAAELKLLFKEKLWNRETKWFDFINDKGKPETRYTIQMYKLIGSSVLDDEILDGLMSHWNEKEFLGPYGIHSLSLQDEAFDPADVDNGGPGACTCFPPQIAERFYKAGQPEIGADILRRLLWLGARMPYWGDSFVASTIDYRHDTPLQCVVDGATIAQCVVFGMFGIDTRFDGTIAISPHLPQYASTAALKQVRIRDYVFDVQVTSDGFVVTIDGQQVPARSGQIVLLEGKRCRVVDAL